MMEAFLPSMRALVARRLSEEGDSQGKISRLLGITQASVSNYLSADLREIYSKLSSIGISPEEGEKYGSLRWHALGGTGGRQEQSHRNRFSLLGAYCRLDDLGDTSPATAW